MAYRIVFHPAAERELEALYDDIAERASPDIAFGYVKGLRTYCDGLTTFPKRGTERNEVMPGLRIVGFRRSASIAFAVGEDVVFILGIYARGREIAVDDLSGRTAQAWE